MATWRIFANIVSSGGRLSPRLVIFAFAACQQAIDTFSEIDTTPDSCNKAAMKRILIGVVLAAVLIVPTGSSGQLKKVRFSVSTIAVAELPFKLAQLKGFYREEGLDVEMILIRGAVGVQALIGKSVDYSSASGALVAAGVRGLDT